MEEYLEMNIKLEIQLILFLLDVCILSEGERGRNLDPCQIDNFVSSLSLSLLLGLLASVRTNLAQC